MAGYLLSQIDENTVENCASKVVKKIFTEYSDIVSDDEVFESAEIILKECVKRIDDSIIKSALKHSLLVLKEIKY